MVHPFIERVVVLEVLCQELQAHLGLLLVEMVVADKVEDMLLVPLQYQEINHKQLQEQQTLEVVVGQQPKDMVLQVWQVVLV